MEKLYGIVHTDDSRYVMAAMRRNNEGYYVQVDTKHWESHDILKRILLFHKSIIFGIHSLMKPFDSKIVNTNIITASDNDSEYPEQKHFLKIITNETDCSIHKNRLKCNLSGIVPEESFLATLPLYMSEDAVDSFLSVYEEDSCYLIGVTVKRKLYATFRMSPASQNMIPGYMGRIKRYWKFKFTETPFPETTFLIGDFKKIPDSAYEETQVKHVAEDIADKYSIKAMGCALALKEKTVPLFSGETTQSRFKKVRTSIFGISAVFLILSVLLLAAVLGTNAWFYRNKIVYENEYKKVIGSNQEIKNLISRNSDLAETILRLEKTFSQQTNWAKLLQAITENRPEDLFLERLGSKPDVKDNHAIRIAITGWAQKETSITGFIAHLQEIPYITSITLSSMERNKKNSNIYLFKILCTLL